MNTILCFMSFTTIAEVKIDAEKVEISMQGFVMERFLNTTVGLWPLESSLSSRSSSSLLLSESEAVSAQDEEDISKYMRMRIVGSFDIKIQKFYAAAHVDLAFNADSGNISFTASNIRHPPFMIQGASLIMVMNS